MRMCVWIPTHLALYWFVCLFESFAGQPVPLKCSWSRGRMDYERERQKGDASECGCYLGPGTQPKKPDAFASSAFLLFS